VDAEVEAVEETEEVAAVEVEAEVEVAAAATEEETSEEEAVVRTDDGSSALAKVSADRVEVVKFTGSDRSDTVQGDSSADGVSDGAVSDANPPAVVPTIYTLAGTSFEKGVTLYHIQMTDGRNLQWAAPVRKRYTEFCQMHAKLQASSLPHCKSLPALPSKGGMISFLRSRQNKKVVDDRERKFTAILEFISLHRELANSSVFQSFVSQRS
ncbi:hypothetical protein Gpo141_00013749, partial [Globisporangium polare]